MKAGDKLIYKELQNNFMSCYQLNKSYTIVTINYEEITMDDDEDDEITFYLTGKDEPYYIWDYFYTQQELRQLKLKSL